MTFRSPRCEPQREEEINPGQETQERLGGHLNLLGLGLHFMYRFCCLLVCSTRKCTGAHIFQMYTLPAGCTPSHHVHSVNRLLQNEGLGSPGALTQVVIVSLQFLPVINRFFLMSVSDLLHSRVRLSFPTTGAPPSICPKYTSSVCYSWLCPCSFSSATSALQGISLLPLTVPNSSSSYDLLYNHSTLE